MKISCFRMKTLLFFLLLFFCFTLQNSFAHNVRIFAWKDGDKVLTESRFSGGGKVKNGQIEVYDDQGRKLLEGKTDNQGRFSFKAPEKTGLDIVLKTGAGHQNHWKIPFESGEKKEGKRTGKTGIPEKILVSQQELETIVERIMDKKLDPIMTMLLDQKSRGPSISDILGGIGYIIGLAGLAALIKSRSRKGD
jgi:nickel transport protein